MKLIVFTFIFQSLMDYVEQNPKIYKKVLAKRKKDEAENAGFVSFLKVCELHYGVPTIGYLLW